MDNENTPNSETSAEPAELSFPWFLVKVTQSIRKLCPPYYTLLKRVQHWYYGQLVSIFIIFMVALITGAVFLNNCTNERMICIFLIVHGTCGIVITLVHTIMAFLNYELMKNGSIIIKYIFIITHVLVIFSIIWFLLGHIWIFKKAIDLKYTTTSCMTNAPRASAIILIFEYCVGLCYLYFCMWNNPSVLHWFQQIIQSRLNHFTSDNNNIPRLAVLDNDDLSNDEMNQVNIITQPINTIDNTTIASQFTKVNGAFFFIGSAILLLLIGTMTTLAMNFPTPTNEISAGLPVQCFTYTTNTDSTRLSTSSLSWHGENSDIHLAAGWYRFADSAGTKLITSPLSTTNICGATFPGWWNGTLPWLVGATNVGNVCFFNGNPCSSSISPILATNCGGYYVFYLNPTPCCASYRYCSTA